MGGTFVLIVRRIPSGCNVDRHYCEKAATSNYPFFFCAQHAVSNGLYVVALDLVGIIGSR